MTINSFRPAFLAVSGAALLGLSSAGFGQVVNENNANGTLATAQDLNGLFGTNFDANIFDPTFVPHVTVIGGSDVENEYDYYSFTVAKLGGAGLTLDIDFGFTPGNDEPDFDPFIALLNSSGSVIMVNDDAFSPDAGSFATFDSYLTAALATGETYFVRVGTCCLNANGQFVGIPFNADYQLHVSLTGQRQTAVSGVPEPSTWAMMLLGFGAVGFGMRQRRRVESAQPQIA